MAAIYQIPAPINAQLLLRKVWCVTYARAMSAMDMTMGEGPTTRPRRGRERGSGSAADQPNLAGAGELLEAFQLRHLNPR